MRQHTKIDDLVVVTKRGRIRGFILACVIGASLATLLIAQLSK
jgi:hypothetical protein